MRLFFTVCLMLSASTVYAAEGILKCEVKKQTSYVMDEGKVQARPSYMGLTNQGDTLDFVFSHRGTAVAFEMIHNERNEIFFWSYFDEGFRVFPDGSYGGFTDRGTTFSIDENSFVVRGWMGSLMLTRYYKGDYHGMLTLVDRDDPQAGLIGLDCKTLQDGIEDVRESLEKKLR